MECSPTPAKPLEALVANEELGARKRLIGLSEATRKTSSDPYRKRGPFLGLDTLFRLDLKGSQTATILGVANFKTDICALGRKDGGRPSREASRAISIP